VDTRVSAAFGRYLVSGGYEFERETFNDRQDNNQPGNARLIVDSRIRQNSHSLYFQNQLSLFAERLQLSASGRWQSFQLDTPVFRLQGIRNPYAGVTLASPPRALTGDIAAAYFVASSGTKFRAHAGNSYRAPSLYERFGGGFFGNPATGQASFTPYGDPRLGPDRYNSFDWGLDQYLWNQRVRVSATHFYVRTKQVIIFDFSGLIRPATDPYGRTSGYTMGPGAINRGAELAVEARPMRGTVIQGSYTFVNANSDRDAVITGFYRALNAPRHTASFLVTQQIGKRLDVTFDVFRSGVHYINYFAAGRNRAYEFPAFTKADLAASYKVWIQDSRSLKAVVRIDNVLNRTYYENGVLNPRAWAVAGLTYSF
jgi:iron complex outermembrane receptor protein